MRHGITACRRTAKVIADQLDAMADALQDWDQGIRCMDRTERVLLAKIAFETRERGTGCKTDTCL